MISSTEKSEYFKIRRSWNRFQKKRKEKKTKFLHLGLSLEEELERRKRGFIAYLAKGTGKWNRR